MVNFGLPSSQLRGDSFGSEGHGSGNRPSGNGVEQKYAESAHNQNGDQVNVVYPLAGEREQVITAPETRAILQHCDTAKNNTESGFIGTVSFKKADAVTRSKSSPAGSLDPDGPLKDFTKSAASQDSGSEADLAKQAIKPSPRVQLKSISGASDLSHLGGEGGLSPPRSTGLSSPSALTSPLLTPKGANDVAVFPRVEPPIVPERKLANIDRPLAAPPKAAPTTKRVSTANRTSTVPKVTVALEKNFGKMPAKSSNNSSSSNGSNRKSVKVSDTTNSKDKVAGSRKSVAVNGKKESRKTRVDKGKGRDDKKVHPGPPEDAHTSRNHHDQSMAPPSSQRMSMAKMPSVSLPSLPTPALPSISSCYALLTQPATDSSGAVVSSRCCGIWRDTKAIDPKHPMFRKWEMIMMALILYTAIITPYETAFMETSLDFLFVLNRTIDLCFLTDLILTLNVAFMDDNTGQWMFDVEVVRRRYLRSWFTLDLLSVLPFDIVGVILENDTVSSLKVLRVVRLARLAKLLRIARAARVFRRLESNYNVNYSFLKMAEFFLVTVCVSHWMACMWSMVESLEEDDMTWIKVAFPDVEDPRLQVHHIRIYVAALYWSIGHMTIGYGDIVPQNDVERAIAMILMLFGALMSGYIIGAAASVLATRDEKRNRFYKTIKMLNDFMEEGRFPPVLRQKLREYFKYACSTNNINAYKELLAQMSPALRGQVACETDNTWIKNIPFFQACPEEFLLNVALRFDQITYPPEEIVFSEGRLNHKVYVIKRGVVSFGGRVKTSGSVMCEDNLYKESINGYNAKTLTFAIVFTLDRTDLLALIDEFPSTKAQFRRLAIKALFRAEVLAYTAAYRRANLREKDQKDYERHPNGMYPIYYTSGNFKCYSSQPPGELSMWDKNMFGVNEREEHYLGKLKLIMHKDPKEQRHAEAACFLIQRAFKFHLKRIRSRNLSRGRGLSRINTQRASHAITSSRSFAHGSHTSHSSSRDDLRQASFMTASDISDEENSSSSHQLRRSKSSSPSAKRSATMAVTRKEQLKSKPPGGSEFAMTRPNVELPEERFAKEEAMQKSIDPRSVQTGETLKELTRMMQNFEVKLEMLQGQFANQQSSVEVQLDDIKEMLENMNRGGKHGF